MDHCAFDFAEMGRQATRILLTRIQDAAKPLEQAAIHRIGFTFVARGTSLPRSAVSQR